MSEILCWMNGTCSVFVFTADDCSEAAVSCGTFFAVIIDIRLSFSCSFSGSGITDWNTSFGSSGFFSSSLLISWPGALSYSSFFAAAAAHYSLLYFYASFSSWSTYVNSSKSCCVSGTIFCDYTLSFIVLALIASSWRCCPTIAIAFSFN